MRNPDFKNVLKILDRKVPDRPTLFEFFLNERLYSRLSGMEHPEDDSMLGRYKFLIAAFKNAGYDYTTVPGSAFGFPTGERRSEKTVSLNEGALISDRESFNAYPWPNPDDFDYSALEKVSSFLPDGMKLIISGPNGVLENVIGLVGYESLCYMSIEDENLMMDIFNAVGERLVRYYEICSKYDTVGALFSNDDWGFNTQTMLSPHDLRKYVFPWHKKIVQVIHSAGKPAILHSCGNLEPVMDDIIDDMKFDGKHSYEDKIMPVEDFYEKYGSRIGVMGGIDLNFVCTSTPQAIKKRCTDMLERTKNRGGYGLGTGNSVPDYVPDENFFAMTSAVL